MGTAPVTRLSLRQRWHRLRTSPRFAFLLLLGMLVAGVLSQAYCYWWDVRIERMLVRHDGYMEKTDVYPSWTKQYLGHKFVARFEPIKAVNLYLNPTDAAAHRPGDLGLLYGALFLHEARLHGKLSEDDVYYLKRLRSLRTIQCTYAPESAMAALVELPNVSHLDLSFEDAPAPAVFQALVAMPKLERLNLFMGFRGRGPGTVAGMKELAKSESIYQLTTELNQEEFFALTSLLPDGSPPLPFLTELRIAGSENGARRSLDNLKNLPSLVHLDLSYWQLTDADLKSLQQLPYLRTLYLESCAAISDQGANLLAAMPNLQSINVKRTNISNEGLFRIATLPHLRCLRAYPTSPEAKLELRKRLPAGCELNTN